MRRPIYLGVIALGVLCGACASSNMAGAGRDTRTYDADINVVVEAANVVFIENGLFLEDNTWTTDSTYVLTGYRKSGLVRTSGEATRVGSVVVFIKRINESQTSVRVETSAQETTVMASSADRRDDEARRFFARLDSHLVL